jgi:hypothetical protein
MGLPYNRRYRISGHDKTKAPSLGNGARNLEASDHAVFGRVNIGIVGVSRRGWYT